MASSAAGPEGGRGAEPAAVGVPNRRTRVPAWLDESFPQRDTRAGKWVRGALRVPAFVGFVLALSAPARLNGG